MGGDAVPESLDFIYVPTADVDGSAARYVEELDAELSGGGRIDEA